VANLYFPDHSLIFLGINFSDYIQISLLLLNFPFVCLDFLFNGVWKHFLLFDYNIKYKLKNNLLIFLLFFKFIKRIEIKSKYDKVEGGWNWKNIF
jgi:hypothetical protein